MDTMGEKYAEGVILDLEKTWEESGPRVPLICFLSMGSDPTDSIIALGKRLKIETRYVSMGQGQEIHARKLLQQTMAHASESQSSKFGEHRWSPYWIRWGMNIIKGLLIRVYFLSFLYLGWMGTSAELSLGAWLYGRVDGHHCGNRSCSWDFSLVDDYRGS